MTNANPDLLLWCLPCHIERVYELWRFADVLVVRSHQGTRTNSLPARELPGIDVSVRAHSHDLLAPPERVGAM